MNAPRFDQLTRALATGLSRRRVVGGIAALFGGTAAIPAVRPATARPAALPREGVSICMPFGGFCSCYPCRKECCGSDDCCSSFTLRGISGSGVVPTDAGVAHFNLFASSRGDLGIPDQPDATQPIVTFQWNDADAGIVLESIQPVYYGPLEGVEGGREAIGWMRVNRAGQVPYIVQAVAAEPVGTEPETIRLLVGDAALDDPAMVNMETTGFRYAADGELVGGDLQLLAFDGVYLDDLATPAT